MNIPYLISKHLTLSGKTSSYYYDMEIFRGYAMYGIIFGHVFAFVDAYSKHGPAYYASIPEYFYNLLGILGAGNGTGFFIFISGFLFYQLNYKRGFYYKEYLTGKFKKIIMPYLVYVFSLFFFRLFLYPHDIKLSYDFFINEVFFYCSFWFIPTMTLIFVSSHLFIGFIEMNKIYQLVSFICSLILAIFLGRHNLNPILSAIFFLPYYLFGIMISINYNWLMTLNFNKKMALIYTWAAIVLLVSAPPYFVIESFRDPWRIDWQPMLNFSMISQLLFCPIFIIFANMVLLKSNIFSSYMRLVAKFSFSIFFIQQFFILLFYHNPCIQFFKELDFWEFTLFAFLFTSFFCICLSLAFIPLKKLSGKYSRMLFGC